MPAEMVRVPTPTQLQGALGAVYFHTVAYRVKPVPESGMYVMNWRQPLPLALIGNAEEIITFLASHQLDGIENMLPDYWIFMRLSRPGRPYTCLAPQDTVVKIADRLVSNLATRAIGNVPGTSDAIGQMVGQGLRAVRDLLTLDTLPKHKKYGLWPEGVWPSRKPRSDDFRVDFSYVAQEGWYQLAYRRILFGELLRGLPDMMSQLH